MVKRIVFICVWTVVFFFGSAMLLGFASGLYFAMSISSGQEPTREVISWIGMTWAFVPMLLGPVGLVLGVLGLLPGTRREMSPP
jgi:hypothetical protein